MAHIALNMQLTDFKTRYNLLQLPSDPSLNISSPLRQAAVLIALTKFDGEIHILLTKRPNHLRSHPGQISFPGGKFEQDDNSLVETALREADEEIALSPDNVEVIGQYPVLQTFTGFEITPVIGIIKKQFNPILDPGEVEELFTVPLSFLIQNKHRQKHVYHRHGKRHCVYFIRYREHLIWGATAAILNRLCIHLQ